MPKRKRQQFKDIKVLEKVDIIQSLEKVENAIIDSKNHIELNFPSFFSRRKFDTNDVSRAIRKYKPIRDALDASIEEDDSFLDKHFKNIPRDKINKYHCFIGELMEYMESAEFPKGETKVRKPRKLKQKPVKEIVKKMVFKQKDDELNLYSVSPLECIGANIIVTYNTSTKNLSKYTFKKSNVKGSSFIDFEQENSFQQRLTKTDILKDISTTTPFALNNLLNSIKTKKYPATGRVNKDTIILRVLK